MTVLQIEFISHASIKLRGAFGTLITDPWILNEPVYAFTTWKYPAAVLPPEDVAHGVDYIYLSHAHEDHFHVPSLDYFDRDTPVIIPDFVDHPFERAKTMLKMLQKMGFKNIIQLKPWETIQLSGVTPFTLIPACQTKYWDWENSGFVLEHPDCKVLNMNDCPSDEALYREVDERFGAFDIAFVQYAGVSMFPGCFRLSHEAMHEAVAQRRTNWQEQKNMAEYLQVHTMAPFAGDFAWLSPAMQHCNWANRATPRLFETFIQTHYPDIDVCIMYPTDLWTKQDGLTRRHPEIDWDHYLAAVSQLASKLSAKVQAIDAWIQSTPCDDLASRTNTYLRRIQDHIRQADIDFNVSVRLSIEGEQANFSVILHASKEAGFVIDMRPSDATQVDQIIYVDQHVWAAVISGKLFLNATLQWASQTEQCVPFRPEIARFWFWLEMFIDLNNRNVQLLVDEALHPDGVESVRVMHGVFDCAPVAEAV